MVSKNCFGKCPELFTCSLYQSSYQLSWTGLELNYLSAFVWLGSSHLKTLLALVQAVMNVSNSPKFKWRCWSVLFNQRHNTRIHSTFCRPLLSIVFLHFTLVNPFTLSIYNTRNSYNFLIKSTFKSMFFLKLKWIVEQSFIETLNGNYCNNC